MGDYRHKIEWTCFMGFIHLMFLHLRTGETNNSDKFHLDYLELKFYNK